MAVVNSILGQARRVQFILKDRSVIQIECSLKETHSRESPASEFPLEDGTTISENIVLKPHNLELEAFISNTPLSPLNSLATAGVSALTSPLGVIGSNAAIVGGSALFKALRSTNSPSIQAYEQLLKLQASKERFTVITTLKRYDNIYVKNLSVPRDVSTGQALQFTISLGQLTLVSPLTVDIKSFKDPNTAAPKQDKGSQQAKEKTAQVSAFEKGLGQLDGANAMEEKLSKLVGRIK